MKLSQTLTNTTLVIISVAMALSASPLAKAQERRSQCYEVRDPDGWSNLRDRNSQEVVARVDSGLAIPIGSIQGDQAVLASPHSSFTIHRSRVVPVDSTRRCLRWGATEPEGYLNLRTSPNGQIIGEINNAIPLLIIGEAEKHGWARILTPSGQTGFVYTARFEVYN